MAAYREADSARELEQQLILLSHTLLQLLCDLIYDAQAGANLT